MVIEGAEKQAGRLWDKFGNYERSSEREMRYVVSWSVGHHHLQGNMHLMEVGRRHQR